MLIEIAQATWDVLVDSSIFMIFGLIMVALLRALVPATFVSRHLGKNGFFSVFKAAVLGAPIPLCSCGVVPVGADLRKRGASKGATASFLISTPETGADSIAITYALLDPVMTVIRPIAAVVTAMGAGVLVNALDKEEAAAPELAVAEGCGCSSCSCSIDPAPKNEIGLSAGLDHHHEQDGHDHAHGHEVSGGFSARLKSGFGFAFGELLTDIGLWYLIGVVVAGVITALVPDDFISGNLSSGIGPMIIMLVAGIPMYVCATSSTPVAAALAMKGLSPGAALVFLLSGPATNAANLAVVSKILGRKAAAIIVGAIAVFSLAIGLAVNWLYASLGLDVTSWVAGQTGEQSNIFMVAGAIVLVGLILLAIIRKKMGHTSH